MKENRLTGTRQCGEAVRENRMDMGDNRRKTTGPVLMTVLLMVILAMAGCSSQSGSGDGGSPSGSFSGKANVTPLTGGAISVDIGDGTTVILDVPEGALEQSTNLTVTVTPQGDKEVQAKAKGASTGIYKSLTISIKPAIDLMEPASLSVVFPENAGNVDRYLTQEAGLPAMIPVKQGFLDNTLKASLYRLSEVECSTPDIPGMISSAYDLMGETPGGTWQDAYALFDALLYFSTRFGENNKLTESQECFSKVADLCKQSALAFLASSGPSGETKDDAHVNALKKYRNLMMLCENPGGIVKSFDAQLLVSDNQK
jgi:hypothetical protein